MPDHGTLIAESEAIETPFEPEGRVPPKRIKVLEPVWGYEFTQQFLNMSLPTLLAPGNLPALAETLPTEFIFLTGRRDEPMIRDSPGYRRLSAICPVSFTLIDDIITHRNHSTTVTLAFAGAVRRTGEAMRDTCFFFLVSDYIVADGSLASVIKLMLAGASAVQSGNFQIIAEEALPWLERERVPGQDALVLPPRRLMQQTLRHVHPTTIANTVNLPVSHNSHANRLFWRVDENTLIGRFYLLHMLCIRPEITNFVIGASCDYSFIPEMCPSGNIAVITDSDQYLVVEAQPRHHEADFLRLGPAVPKQIAASLSEWTTALHRDNVRQTLIFHGADLPVSLGSVVGEADSFICEIGRWLKPKPMPHRGHPYWRGAIAAHHGETGRRPNEDDWQLMLGRRATWTTRLAGGLRNFLLGRAPHVRRWHPRWRDFEGPRNALAQLLDNPEKRLLTVSSRPTPMTNWLADRSENVRRIPISRLPRANLDLTDTAEDRFDACYLEIGDSDLDRAHLVVDQIVPLLRPNAEILLASYNERWVSGAEVFAEKVGNGLPPIFHRLDVTLSEMQLVAWRRWRWAANARLLRLAQGVFRRGPILVPLYFILIPVQALIAFGGNLADRRGTLRSEASGQIVSSVFLRLRAASGGAWPGRETCAGPSPSPAKAGSTSTVCRAHAKHATTKEPQYQRLLEVQQEAGTSTLGLMTNQVWHDDPRRLAFILARYKFVAKMLRGYHAVAEVGCGDAFATRIVQQEVDTVTPYDFDAVFIRDIQRRQSAKWPLPAQVHDILERPLPQRYDAIYSLDVIEHIPAEKEDAFIGNLGASLAGHGVLIIGSPSLESQAYASPQSKLGHVNCKSGHALKLLLERHFHTVFLFSMNDEVVHTGFYPMAHYLLAICSDIRR
jgi:2-polyprenyl-3-methyl-5-hydroxy-6-metoxy-1,4-benzoquinol methylase